MGHGDYMRFLHMRIQRDKLLVAATALMNHALNPDHYWGRLREVVGGIEDEAKREPTERLPEPRLK